MPYLKVEGTNFVKDTKSNALLMTGRNALIENEARKNLSKRLVGKDDEINKLKDKVDVLSSDIHEIKSLLNMIITQSKEKE
jgi:hypothetical protein